jgi:hypothetical protein
VTIKGLSISAGAERRINVTVLQMVAQSCTAVRPPQAP